MASPHPHDLRGKPWTSLDLLKTRLTRGSNLTVDTIVSVARGKIQCGHLTTSPYLELLSVAGMQDSVSSCL